jgi:hypothetical protein
MQASMMRFSSLGAAALLILALGCSTITGTDTPAQTLDATQISPAAVGTIDIQQDANENQRLRVQVDHLAPPEALDPQAQTYVMWIQPQDSSVYYNAGQLQINEDRSASLQATTPFSDFEVMITAEPHGHVLQPSQLVVLRTQIRDNAVDEEQAN